jgi:pimeloyl-ACP methyl ester carboxylesterase
MSILSVEADMPETTILNLSAGPIPVRDWGGDGEPVLLVHGLVVNGRLWDGVAERLAAAGLRVVVPDLPLGAHTQPTRPGADLSPRGIAGLLGEIAEALGLEGVTLVGNDTGGAICQLAAASRPAWLGRLVLTPCDAYENFLPPAFRPLQVLARRAPWALVAGMQPLRLRALRNTPLLLGWLTKRGVSDEISDGWVRPFFDLPATRRDLIATLAAIDNADTIAAATELRSFDRPALVIWADGDRFFPRRLAERLAADIPGARLERIADSYAFTPLDQPQRTAELIEQHIAATPGSGPAPGVAFTG